MPDWRVDDSLGEAGEASIHRGGHAPSGCMTSQNLPELHRGAAQEIGIPGPGRRAWLDVGRAALYGWAMLLGCLWGVCGNAASWTLRCVPLVTVLAG